MWSSLVLVHNDHENRIKTDFPDFVSWHTCMRSIYLSDERLLSVDIKNRFSDVYQIFYGYDAYSFLIQIVCGLHSKLFGESEIQAQFCDSFSKEKLPDNSLSAFLLKLRDQILEHTKIVRTKFLIGIGKQSYGSLTEKYISKYNRIDLIGTGNLAESLLPYLKTKNRQVNVFGRNKTRLNSLKEIFNIQTFDLEDYIPNPNPVIIAVTDMDENKTKLFHLSNCIIDFRENSKTNFLDKLENYIPFTTLLGSIQETNILIQELKPKIELLIADLTELRQDEQTHFMNGWEDLTHA